MGDQPCTIISIDQTIIQCQTSALPSTNRTHYHGKCIIHFIDRIAFELIGGRGLHAYYDRVFTDLVSEKKTS